MELRPGFKRTEAGVVPVDWEVERLFAICSMKSGETITSANIDQFSRYPCYGGNGRRGFTNRFTHDGRYSLIGRQGALCGNVLGVEGQFFASEHAIVVTPSKQTDIRWLTFVLGEMRLNRYSEASAQPGLSVSKLLNIDVAHPPSKAEQEAIAKALTDADALIETLEQLLEKKRHIKQGATQELLTGKKRLPGFEAKLGLKQTEVGVIPEDWEVVDAGSIGRFRGGNGFPTIHQGISSGEYPFFKVSDMNNEGNETFMDVANNYISEATRRRLGANAFPPQTIVFAKVGAAIFLERKKLLTKASCLDNNMAGFSISDAGADHRYIYYFFLNFRLGSLVSTTALPSLNGSVLRSIKIILPPTKAEQTAIATMLSDMDADIAALDAKLAKARQIKQGMMQELLTGRIRLA
jgi:type I restriction enzyme S subunit